jgi:hypothetical protein
MSDPPQGPGPVEETRGLKEWLACDNALARFKAGDAYIATRNWQYDQTEHPITIFGHSVTEEAAQVNLKDFLNRNRGVWNVDPQRRDPQRREAKWRTSESNAS